MYLRLLFAEHTNFLSYHFTSQKCKETNYIIHLLLTLHIPANLAASFGIELLLLNCWIQIQFKTKAPLAVTPKMKDQDNMLLLELLLELQLLLEF